MQDTLRLFIAIELSAEIHKNLAEAVRLLRIDSGTGISWVKPENIHLTLKFLGDTPRVKIPAITQTLTQKMNQCAQCAPFNLTVRGTGCFPSPRQPRVLWVGVEAPEELNDLQQAVEKALLPLDIPNEKRPFSPHLTLARINNAAESIVQNKYQQLLTYRESNFGQMSAEYLTLFQSTLARTGSIYTPLARIPLNQMDESMLKSTQKLR